MAAAASARARDDAVLGATLKSFGTKGDGVADDSRAWAAALAATAGRTLYAPAGTYRLNSSITIPANTTVIMHRGARFSHARGASVTNNGVLIWEGGGATDPSGRTLDTVRGQLIDQRNGSGPILPSEHTELVWNMDLVVNDGVDVCAGTNGQTKSNGRFVKHMFGGAGMSGGRHAIYGVAHLTGTSRRTNPDRNYVAIQGHAIAGAHDNGTAQDKQGALFGLASVAHLGAKATHFLNVTACEFNTLVEAGTAPGYRAGIQIASRDEDRGVTYDCMIGLSDIASNANGLWTHGILVGPMNSKHPLRSDGTILKTVGSSTIATGIDLSSYTVTDSVVKSSKASLQDGFLVLTATNSSIEMGNPREPNAPYLDFHSSGQPVDYDVRIQATGGARAPGSGTLNLVAASVQTRRLQPAADNHFTLGSASMRWSEIFAANGTINTSDARKKENFRSIDAAQAERFLAALKPVRYRFKDYTVPDVVETETVDMPVMRDEEYFEDRVEYGESGEPRVVRKKLVRQVVVTKAIPVVDEDGQPVMEDYIRYAVDGSGNLIQGSDGKPIAIGLGRRPATKEVTVTERKPVARCVREEVVKTHRRTHWGLLAQDVERALAACGLSSRDFGGFVYDPEADLYGLRYDQFIAPLIAAVNGLAERVRRLEAQNAS
jgi:hypothetical protein